MAFQPIKQVLGVAGVDEGCSWMTVQLRNCPELPLLVLKQIYPQSVAVSMTEKITSTQTKGGHMLEHWPSELDGVSVQALTGGFFLLNSTYARSTFRGAITKLLTQTTGLATSNVLQPLRRYTNPAQTAAEMEKVYRINGALYSEDGEIVRYRPVVLTWMNYTFFGYFESMKVEHNVEKLNLYTVSFEFKAQNMVIQPNRNLLGS